MSNPKIAVILAGCGFLDGAEIREAVLALTALDKNDAEVEIFAPNINQHHVIDHLSGEEVQETRNVLVEAARIARGNITALEKLDPAAFDAVVIPGGFGVAKNLSDLAFKGAEATVLPEFKEIVRAFLKADKPIGAICISPAVLVAAIREDAKNKVHVTIGDDADGLIESLGGIHQECPTRGVVIDDANHIVTTSAYMREDRLAEVERGIDQLVAAVLNQVALQKNAA